MKTPFELGFEKQAISPYKAKIVINNRAGAYGQNLGDVLRKMKGGPLKELPEDRKSLKAVLKRTQELYPK